MDACSFGPVIPIDLKAPEVNEDSDAEFHAAPKPELPEIKTGSVSSPGI